MKIRNGFVSNSSSSSFVIHKGFLSEDQINKIISYDDVVEEYLIKNPLPEEGYYSYDSEAPEYDFSYLDSSWRIVEGDNYIFGETSMDNFDFSAFFKYIKVDDERICWDDGYNDEPTPHQKAHILNETKKLRKNKIKKIDKNK